MNTADEVQDRLDDIDAHSNMLLPLKAREWVQLLVTILQQQLVALTATPEELAAGGNDPVEKKQREVDKVIASTLSVEAQFERTLAEMQAALGTKEMENRQLVQEIDELRKAIPKEVADSDAVKNVFVETKRRYARAKAGLVVADPIYKVVKTNLDKMWVGFSARPEDLAHRPFSMAMVHMLTLGPTDISTLKEGFAHYGPIAALCDFAMTWMAIASLGYIDSDSRPLLCTMAGQAAINAVDGAPPGSLFGASGLHGLLEKLYINSGAYGTRDTATILRRDWEAMRQDVKDGAMANAQGGQPVVVAGGNADQQEIARLNASLAAEQKAAAAAKRDNDKLSADVRDLEATVNRQNRNIGILEGDKQDLNTRLAAAGNNAAATKTITDLQSQVRDAKGREAEALKKLLEETKRVDDGKKLHDAEMKKATDNAKKIEGERARLDNDLKDANSRLNTAAAELSAARKDTDAVQISLKKVERELASTKTENLNQKSMITNLENASNDMKALTLENTKLNNEAARLQTAVSNLSTENARINSLLARANSDLQTARNGAAQAASDLSHAQANVAVAVAQTQAMSSTTPSVATSSTSTTPQKTPSVTTTTTPLPPPTQGTTSTTAATTTPSPPPTQGTTSATTTPVVVGSTSQPPSQTANIPFSAVTTTYKQGKNPLWNGGVCPLVIGRAKGENDEANMDKFYEKRPKGVYWGDDSGDSAEGAMGMLYKLVYCEAPTEGKTMINMSNDGGKTRKILAQDKELLRCMTMPREKWTDAKKFSFGVISENLPYFFGVNGFLHTLRAFLSVQDRAKVSGNTKGKADTISPRGKAFKAKLGAVLDNDAFYEEVPEENKPSLPLGNLLVLKFVVWYRCKHAGPEPSWADDLVGNLIDMHLLIPFLDYPVRLITSLLFDFYSEEGPASEVELKEDSPTDNMGLFEQGTQPKALKEGYAAALMYYVHHHYAYPLMHALARKVGAMTLGEWQVPKLWAWLKYVAKRMMNKHWYQGVKTNDNGENKKLEEVLRRFHRVSYAPKVFIRGVTTMKATPPDGVDMGAYLSINPPAVPKGKSPGDPGHGLSTFGFILVMTLSNVALNRSFCMERMTGNHPLSVFLEHMVNSGHGDGPLATGMLNTIGRDYLHLKGKLEGDADAGDDNIYEWLNVNDAFDNMTHDFGNREFNNKDDRLFFVGKAPSNDANKDVLYEDIVYDLFRADDKLGEWDSSFLDIVVWASMGFVGPWSRVASAMGGAPDASPTDATKKLGDPAGASVWLLNKVKHGIKEGNPDGQTRYTRDLLGGLFDVNRGVVTRSYLDDYAAGFLVRGITEDGSNAGAVTASALSSNDLLKVSSLLKDNIHRVDVPTLVTPQFILSSNDTTLVRKAYVARGAANRDVGVGASLLGVGAGVGVGGSGAGIGVGVGGLGTGVGLGVTACGDKRQNGHCISVLMDKLASNDPVTIERAMKALAGMLGDRTLDEAWSAKTAKERSEVRRKAIALSKNQAFVRFIGSDFFMTEVWNAIRAKIGMANA